ncbi:MAG: MAE_28990/MAE_18760 family HEPN-like nuclease [Cyanobacteria bacterium P01_E01_bin.42]
MKSLVEQRSLPLNRHNVLVRGGICILYAHWEGFINRSHGIYRITPRSSSND